MPISETLAILFVRRRGADEETAGDRGKIKFFFFNITVCSLNLSAFKPVLRFSDNLPM